MTGSDNSGCHVDVLEVMQSYVGDRAQGVQEATTPADALRALAELEAACRKARERVAVRLVLDDGASYAELGTVLGMTRQGARKVYGPVVEAEMRSRARARR